jgi:hypothetical protein
LGYHKKALAAKTVRNPLGAGRKQVVIDTEQVEKLAQLGATQVEMARFLDVAHSTLEYKLQQPEFRQAYERGLGNLHMSLKRKQVEMALAGDRTMLIWLGKNYLGQRDNLDSKLTGSGPNGEIEVDASPVEQIERGINRILQRKRAPGDLGTPDAGAAA